MFERGQGNARSVEVRIHQIFAHFTFNHAHVCDSLIVSTVVSIYSIIIFS